MARNEEKAMSMLNRWLRVQSGEEDKKAERRPHLATLCETLPECEKWRRQILKEVTKKVGEIQNPGLGEFKIRDLNDEINKLLREKGHWERRIIDLGGPNYLKSSAVQDADGNEVISSSGYRYFGAAKDLPGVRDLFRKQDMPLAKRSRAAMYKCADATYFGYRDDDDGVLVPLEEEAEKSHVAAAVLEWTERQASGAAADEDEDEGKGEEGFVAHVPVPTAEAIEKAVLEQKKKEMMARYATAELAESQERAKEISDNRKRGRE